MSTRYKIFDNSLKYFVTLTVVGWIDVFSNKLYRDIIIKSLEHWLVHKGLKVHAWVIMTNHMHMIISCKKGYFLSNILRDFKKFTSQEILITIINNNHESRKEWMLQFFKNAGRKNSNNVNYQFWIQDNHPIYIDNSIFIYNQKLQYIHNNPVKSGIVENAEEYLYSSARDYYGLKGLLKIEMSY